MKIMKKKLLILLTVTIVGVVADGRNQHHEANANASEGGAEQVSQALPVSVEIVASKPIEIWNNYSAHLEAVDFAQIRPQVSGTITEVKFEDGQMVEEGQVLYVIDPRPYEAAVNQSKAELIAAKNQSSFSWKELKRAKELIKTKAISKRVLEERRNTYNVDLAIVKGIEARLERAQINLDYAYIKAPIGGRISRAEIKEGNLVEAGANAPVLTSIVSIQNIYADFEVDEKSYLKYIRGNARDLAEENKIPVKLTLNNDPTEYQGFIHSFDNQIDVSSGTIRARALFTNAEGIFLPGMFANVKMGTSSSVDRVLISERAIGTDQSKKFVYVVNDKNTVEYREVKIGKSVEGKRVILSGLSDDDQVIVAGIIKIRPGMLVAPQFKKEASNTVNQAE